MKKTYHSLIQMMSTLHLSHEETLCLIGCGQMTPRILVENIRTQALPSGTGKREGAYVSGLFSLTPRQCGRILQTGQNTLFYLPGQGDKVISLPQPLVVELSDLIVTNDDYEWVSTFYPEHEAPEPQPLSEPHEACTSSKPNAISERLPVRP